MRPNFAGSGVRRELRALQALLVCLAMWLSSGAAFAQTGERVTLEFAEGPLATSNRVIGLGGAFVAIAEGADGHMFNPASFAVRFPYTRNDDWDWDWTLYWLNPGENTSLDPAQPPGSTGDASFIGAGIDVKITILGGGLHAWGQSRTLRVPSPDGTVVRQYTFSQTTGGLGIAMTIPPLQLTLGQFTGPANFEIRDGGRDLVQLRAAQSTTGLLWAPRDRPVRAGLVYRAPSFLSEVCIVDADGGCAVTGPGEDPRQSLPEHLRGYVPDGFVIPGRFAAGFSFMAWERIYNPPHTWGLEDAEEIELARRYVLGSVDWHVTAGSQEPVRTFDSFLRQERVECAADYESTGQCVPATFGLRAGVESELIPNWFRLRAGYYFEPSRTPGTRGRHHATSGADVKVPFWPWDLRANTAFDVSVNYFNWGLGVGFWH